MGVAVVLVVFVALSLGVALLRPPWEAFDEDSHVQNIETLVRGRWYRIDAVSRNESHQPPLYYLLLAGWQKVTGVSPRNPTAHFVGFDCSKGCVDHSLPTDAADGRLVRWLRLPSVLFSALVVLLTAAVARRLSSDPWTPVLAAAIVASVPQFVLFSGSVNNDHLANVLGALALWMAVVFVQREPRPPGREPLWALGFGVVLGCLAITKLSTAGVVFIILVAIWSVRASRARRAALLAIAALGALAVSGWWLIRNQLWYGDVLGANRSRDHLGPSLGLGLARDYNPLRIMFVDVPRHVARSFWLNAGTPPYFLETWMYQVLWGSAAVAAVLAVVQRFRSPPGRLPGRLGWSLLTAGALGAVAGVWIVALQSNTFMGRNMYVGLAALACLAALALERSKLPVLVRFVMPTLALLATIYAFKRTIIDVWY